MTCPFMMFTNLVSITSECSNWQRTEVFFWRNEPSIFAKQAENFDTGTDVLKNQSHYFMCCRVTAGFANQSAKVIIKLVRILMSNPFELCVFQSQSSWYVIQPDVA